MIVLGLWTGVCSCLFSSQNMEQQPHVREFYDRSMTDAIRALDGLKVGESICFVGLRELAEGLVSIALERGLRLEPQYQVGFGEHFLTLVERGNRPEPIEIEDEPVSTWQSWVRSAVYGMFHTLWNRRIS